MGAGVGVQYLFRCLFNLRCLLGIQVDLSLGGSLQSRVLNYLESKRTLQYTDTLNLAMSPRSLIRNTGNIAPKGKRISS